jgi:hypothetical protein
MSEPTTVITDYLLGAVATWVSVLLLKNPQRSQRFWALAFAALAAGAFLGGTWHGFMHSELLWKAAVLSVGVASFGMVAGSAVATMKSSILPILAAIKLAAYIGWMLFHDEFIYAVLDTGIALLAVAALHLWKWNGRILAGVGLSAIAGLVQASGFTLHEHFNHNDLYHLIQIAGVVVLYQGAKRLQSS